MNSTRKDRKIYTFEETFTPENLLRASFNCENGVAWKESVQRYAARRLEHISAALKDLDNLSFCKGFKKFDITERGKRRRITATFFAERVIQKCLCDNALTPAVSARLIYDSGACLKGKGTDFTRARLMRHLAEYVRENGAAGYIFLFDGHDYFNSVCHEALKRQVDELPMDGRLKAVVYTIIDSFGERGLGLGSQASQDLALLHMSWIDHKIKEVLKERWYGRYNDDGYIIGTDVRKLRQDEAFLRGEYAALGLALNEKKTCVCRLSDTWTFLKTRYRVTESGHIVRRPVKGEVSRQVRKCGKLAAMVKAGDAGADSARSFCASIDGHIRHFNAGVRRWEPCARKILQEV